MGNALRNSLTIDKEGNPKSVPKKNWSHQDKWLNEIFQKVQVLAYHLHDIRSIQNSTNLTGIDEFLKKNEIHDYYFLKYTYENHQIRVVSTLDICSKLGNTVFQLSIKERYCNWYQYINELGKSHNSSQILLDFANAIDQNRGERNSIIHTGDYVNEILDWYDTYSIDEEYLQDDLLINSFRKYRNIQRSNLDLKMSKDTEKCYNHSKRFLNSLVNAF